MKARFVSSHPNAKGLPLLRDSRGKQCTEVVVIGRSNVGKSSLLNYLFGTTGLVKTSSTPGKTRLLNLFCYGERWAFVDLPGYGFAKVAHEVQGSFQQMVEGYFKERQALSAVLFVWDIRRDPVEEDRMLMQWLHKQPQPMILVINKGDKVSNGALKGRCEEIAQAFGVEGVPFIAVSAWRRWGGKELWRLLEDTTKMKETT